MNKEPGTSIMAKRSRCWRTLRGFQRARMMAGRFIVFDTLRVASLTLLASLLCCQARGAILVREDWRGGRIDTNRWEFAGMPINASLVDIGGGDWALRLREFDGFYQSGLRSRAAFAREQPALHLSVVARKTAVGLDGHLWSLCEPQLSSDQSVTTEPRAGRGRLHTLRDWPVALACAGARASKSFSIQARVSPPTSLQRGRQPRAS